MSGRGRLFVWTVVVLGALAVCHALIQLVEDFPGTAWLFVAGLTLISGTATVKLPGVAAHISVSETFLFTAVLLFGQAAGVATVVLDAAIATLMTAKRGLSVEQTLFNLSAPSLAIWVGAAVFPAFGIKPVVALSDTESVKLATLILPLLIFTVLYFSLNSGFVALAVGFSKNLSPYQVWRKHFAWLSLNYFGGASISAMLVVAYSKELHWTYVAVIVPLLLILYLTFRNSMARVADANRHLAELNALYLATVQTLAAAIDAKDQVTHGHIRRVQHYALELARAVGIKNELQLRAIQAAAVLHDTGKIAIPESILNKPGPLDADEFEIMKQHAAVGADIISSINFPYPVEPIVRFHHENWDGTGYPERLVGTEIPIGARVLAVVDCFDALTSDRPYRGRLSDQAALAIIAERRGRMYDPLVVDTFIRIYATLRASLGDLALSNEPSPTLGRLERPLVQPPQFDSLTHS